MESQNGSNLKDDVGNPNKVVGSVEHGACHNGGDDLKAELEKQVSEAENNSNGSSDLGSSGTEQSKPPLATPLVHYLEFEVTPIFG